MQSGTDPRTDFNTAKAQSLADLRAMIEAVGKMEYAGPGWTGVADMQRAAILIKEAGDVTMSRGEYAR